MEKLRKYKSVLLITAILLLAAVLRLYRVGDYMTFLGDEGRDLLAVKQILEGDLIFLGPRSSAADFYYGPIYFYFITPFLWLFNYDPIGPAVFIGILGVITVYLVYYVMKQTISEKAGLFAAALYTVSPLVIAYSRSSWNPNPLPFVSLLSIYVVYKAVQKNSWKLFLFVGFLFGIAIQLQYLALFLGIILALFIILSRLFFLPKSTFVARLKTIVRDGLVVLGGFIIGWSPFLAFELKNNFPNLRTLITFLFFGNTEKVYPTGMGFWENIQSVFFKLYARLVMRFPPPEQVTINENPNLQLWQIAIVILSLVTVYALFKMKNKLFVLLLSLWLFVGCFLFGFYKKDIYDYYLGFMFPLPFLLLGNALAYYYEKSHKYAIWKLLVGVVFLGLFIFNLYGNPFQYEPNRQKDQVKNISEFVLSKTNGKPYNFALLTKGNSDHGYRYFFSINNRQPVEIKNREIDPQRNSVTDQLLIVCEYTDCKPLGDSLWEIAGFGRAEIAGEWNVSVVKVFRLVPYKE